jgi:heme/copper-type cytochrome/quinol oxidase subunit 3
VSVSAGGGVAPGREDPRLAAANLSVGVRLLVSAIVFVFMSFVFAFFYLKAVNSNGNWRPAHVNPSQGYGIAILICVLGTTLCFELARRAGVQADSGTWRTGAAVALVLALAAVVLGILQITATDFGVTGGGYASVFYGWNALWIAIWLGAVYWVETLLATGLRRLPDPEMPDADPLELLRPSADACMVYLYTSSGVAIVTYVMLYLIK